MKYDVLVIGGGIVGLATALKLQEKNPTLRMGLIEKESKLAQHQTGHNSGVIHSGIYYQPGSLKAKNCIEGYHQLIAFCQQHGIAYELCGKVIVATSPAEFPALERIFERGKANGLEGLKMLDTQELKEYEPHVAGLRGIFVPQTGIIDYKEVALKYGHIFQENGGSLHLGEKVLDIRHQSHFSEVFTTKRAYQTKLLINCAGLYSDQIAALNQPDLSVRIIPFRGEYYMLKPEKRHLVRNLIYPVPNPNFPFLGVHFTRMISGDIEAGPNAVFAFKKEGYRKIDFQWNETWASLAWPGFRKVATKYWQIGLGEFYRSFSKDAFTRALQKLIPEVQKKDLIPAGAGVRAQACDKYGGLLDDFKIIEDNYLINVLNAPSPAATSSLSIGTTVAEMAQAHLT